MRAAILLAAGSSRRYGAANKLLAGRGGVPLVVRALRIAQAAPVGRTIVVTGAQHPRVAGALRAAGGRRPLIVRARRHREGLSASLKAGIGALWPGERVVFLFLADMPAVPPGLARRLAWRLQPGVRAVRPVHRGLPGHPVLLRVPDGAELGGLRGDQGLGPLLRPLAQVPAGRGVVIDIDRPRTLSHGLALSGGSISPRG